VASLVAGGDVRDLGVPALDQDARAFS